MYRATYTARARCDCGFLWTTHGSPNVLCACTDSLIEGHVLQHGPNLEFTEEEFKQACADDIGADVDEIEVKYEPE